MTHPQKLPSPTSTDTAPDLFEEVFVTSTADGRAAAWPEIAADDIALHTAEALYPHQEPRRSVSPFAVKVAGVVLLGVAAIGAPLFIPRDDVAGTNDPPAPAAVVTLPPERRTSPPSVPPPEPALVPSAAAPVQAAPAPPVAQAARSAPVVAAPPVAPPVVRVPQTVFITPSTARESRVESPQPASPPPAPVSPSPPPSPALETPAVAVAEVPVVLPPAPAAAATELPRFSTSAAVAPPAPPPAISEETQIRAILDRYRDAYASLNVSAVQTVWPKVDARALARAFDQLSMQQFDFAGCQISVAGDAASAGCSGNAQYATKVGNRNPRVQARVWTFELRKIGPQWTVQSVDTR